jgi:chaperonin cofactor prefoldin
MMEQIIERLEAVQVILSSACTKEEANCGWEEMDVLIPAVRELQKENERLEKRVEELEGGEWWNLKTKSF